MVDSGFRIAPLASWAGVGLRVYLDLPETFLTAAVGRKLCEVVAHPLLEGAMIAEVARDEGSVTFHIAQRPPLLLLPDGSVVTLTGPERDAVMANLAAFEEHLRTGVDA